MKLGEAMYQANQAQGGGDDGAAPRNDDAVDVDFEEVDEDDRKKSA
jgi:molecular chaperone DnaK